jgi:hypothetical protein
MKTGKLALDTSYRPEYFDTILPSERRMSLKPFLVDPDTKPLDYEKVFVFSETVGHDRIWDFKTPPCPFPYWGNPDLCWKIIAYPHEFPEQIVDDIANGKIKPGDIVTF